MYVKGNAWLARSEAMERELGVAVWKGFLERQKPSFLETPVMPISKIACAPFLALHDALVKEFFDGDEKVYWRFGETSAEWALKNQLRGLFSDGEGRRFLNISPSIYKLYFDAGEFLVEPNPAHVDLVLRGVQPRHVYFEYSVMGFAACGLRLLRVPNEPECISGFSKGDGEVRYRFAVTK